jgi:hypothetical protein
MKKKNLLIIGSNFGKLHLNASIKSKKFSKIYISSPNIFKKKITEKVIKYKNFKIPIKKHNIDMITIATTPEVQNNVLLFLLKSKIYPKFIFLEKPILDRSLKIIEKFPIKILILTNFIFLFSKSWKYFKNLINRNINNYSFEYIWSFKQAYFVNKKPTWKINSNKGGLVNYYLPHVIFNILSFFQGAKLIKIIKKKYTYKKLTYLKLVFLLNNKYSFLEINNNSNKNLHSFKIKNKLNNVNFLISNKTKKWLSNFKIYKQNILLFKLKKKIIVKDEREEVLLDFYSKINYYYKKNNVKKNKALTIKTFDLIRTINSKI